MSGYGIPQDDIAKVLGISRTTLGKHFRAELDTAATKANSKVAETLWKQATTGNVTAAIWWTKARMRWSETAKHEVTIDDGGLSEVERAQRVAAILAVVPLELEHTEAPESQETASES